MVTQWLFWFHIELDIAVELMLGNTPDILAYVQHEGYEQFGTKTVTDSQ